MLGVLHGFYPALPRELKSIPAAASVPAFEENSNIAIVFPSWKLRQILELRALGARVQQLLEEGRKP